MSDFKLKSDKNKTIRFALTLVEEINEIIKNEDVTFSDFVIEAYQYG